MDSVITWTLHEISHVFDISTQMIFIYTKTGWQQKKKCQAIQERHILCHFHLTLHYASLCTTGLLGMTDNVVRSNPQPFELVELVLVIMCMDGTFILLF